MKKKMIPVIAILLSGLLYAEGYNHISAGFGLSDNAGNLGMNLEITSPAFAYDKLRITLESQLDYLSKDLNDSSAAWEAFSSHRLGIAMGNSAAEGNMFLYGEFGGLLILPSDKVSEDIFQAGIYGLFGFEIYIDDGPISYYLEAGTNSNFSDGDLLINSPDYYTGFCTKTGFRIYF